MRAATALRMVAFTAGAFILNLSCTSPYHQPPLPSSGMTAQPRIRAAALEQRIHELINQERRTHGLSPLKWDDALAGVARKHSADMGSRNYFDHLSPDGRDFAHRYRADGYTCEVRRGSVVYGGAENIFQNNRYDSMTRVNEQVSYDWNSEEKIARTTVQGWMASPGHRKNILTPHWGREGIGVVLTEGNRIYITQNFC